MCTGIFIQSPDGNYYQTRTLEFEAILPYLPVVSKNIIGSTLRGNIFIDGINSHGLCVMAFYFKCNASYKKTLLKTKINLASYEVVGYFLKNAHSVEDVVEKSKMINVTQQRFGEPFNSVIPLHWFISDNKGNTIIVEAENGKLICYDNSNCKVCTNNPSYPEQITNLKTILNRNKFSYNNPPNKTGCGMGKGLIGVPGDYSSEGRFVRAYVLSEGIILPAFDISNVKTLFHFNNNFDIVYGACIDTTSDPPLVDFTQYTAVYDLTNLTAYYKTYHEQKIIKLGSLEPA